MVALAGKYQELRFKHELRKVGRLELPEEDLYKAAYRVAIGRAQQRGMSDDQIGRLVSGEARRLRGRTVLAMENAPISYMLSALARPSRNTVDKKTLTEKERAKNEKIRVHVKGLVNATGDIREKGVNLYLGDGRVGQFFTGNERLRANGMSIAQWKSMHRAVA